MKEKAFYVWTIGNRNVNKREIPNDKILIDLMRNKGVDLIFNVEREILNKKQSKTIFKNDGKGADINLSKTVLKVWRKL